MPDLEIPEFGDDRSYQLFPYQGEDKKFHRIIEDLGYRERVIGSTLGDPPRCGLIEYSKDNREFVLILLRFHIREAVFYCRGEHERFKCLSIFLEMARNFEVANVY